MNIDSSRSSRYIEKTFLRFASSLFFVFILDCSAEQTRTRQTPISTAGAPENSESSVGDASNIRVGVESQIKNDSGYDGGLSDICGDGRVSGTETCDIAISSSSPGACPDKIESCPDTEGCTSWKIIGSACQTECVAETPPCRDDDGCCPKTCSATTDSDCSTSCGDGIVQSDQGEICEPMSALEGVSGKEAIACPTECEQDDDPCTTELLSGSEENCDAQCLSVRVETVSSEFEDGCCPSGANANTDIDCEPTCGNGVREADEECDGAEGCNDACEASMTENQKSCIDNYDIYEDACEKCVCANCTDQAMTCLNSGESVYDEHCSQLLACGYQNDCIGPECYCGSELVRLTGTCLIGDPDGPCISEIEDAADLVAGDSSILTIALQEDDIDTPIGRAFAFGECYERNCLDICRPNRPGRTR